MSWTQITCEEFVELVTDYLEGTLDPATADRFESHVRECRGCGDYLDQFRETIRIVGRIEPERVDPTTLDVLLNAFRDWKSS